MCSEDLVDLRLVTSYGPHDGVLAAASGGVLVSNAAHMLSVIVLYQITLLLNANPTSFESSLVAFVTASLHIVSPAGLFLSAPYAESCFSLLNFAGFYLYALSVDAHGNKQHNLRDGAILLLSGLLFGLATTFRSNGLLSGSILCAELVEIVLGLREKVQTGDVMASLRRSMFLFSAGGIMALGSLYPQYLAYREYCVAPSPPNQPSWCTRLVPSIYTWVQSRYW